jgi:hypothetical protein
MELMNDGTPTSAIRSPGDGNAPFTSVKNENKYRASIGIRPVVSILQVPNVDEGGPLNYSNFVTRDPAWEPPIFASTARSGLWSYRSGQWNAED